MIDKGPDSRVGRTSTEVVFAADLGGTNLRAATVDENGKIHFRLKQNTPQAESRRRLSARWCSLSTNAKSKVKRPGIACAQFRLSCLVQ
jgi:predicted NBD/HSP70 family sugar kinase